VGYASYGQLRSCGKIIICGKSRALTKHILWQCTLVGYAFWGRLRSHGKIVLYPKILAITEFVVWQYTLVGYTSYGQLRRCGKIINFSQNHAINSLNSVAVYPGGLRFLGPIKKPWKNNSLS